MAVVKFIASRKPQSRGGLHGSMLYCTRKDKTWDERTRRQLVTGVNCLADTAYQEFLNTKRLYGKTEGRMYYHVLQSFSPDEALTAETAHEIALKLAQEFAGFEVLVCTHTDRDHLHSHLIINSVSAEDGRKYHSDKDNIQRIRQASDQLCLQYGLSVIKPKNKRTPGMSAAEYRSANKGQSWKLRLAIAIDEAMAAALSRDHFLELMALEGYRVRWEKDRKYITYTTPEGKQCRDIRLHETKYLKENMEREFRIRKQILSGIEAADEAEHGRRSQTGAGLSGDGEELEWPAEISGRDPGNAGSLLRRDADPGVTGGTGENPGPAADHDAGASGRYEGAVGGVPDVHRDDGDEFADTGWECERQLFRRYLEGGSVHEILAHEAALDLGDPFGGADPAGAGALDLVGSLSRLKGDPDDPEERRREIEARNAADNLGIAIGLAIAAAEAIKERESAEMAEQTL